MSEGAREVDCSVPVLLPRALKELTAEGPLALCGFPWTGVTGSPALACGLRFPHVKKQFREASWGD